MLLSFEDATALCQNYQYLVGNQIVKGRRNIATVKAVVIAPYDNFNKFRFLEEYKRTKRVENSLQFYDGFLYDILLISEPLQGSDIFVCELQKYLSEFSPEPQSRKALV